MSNSASKMPEPIARARASPAPTQGMACRRSASGPRGAASAIVSLRLKLVSHAPDGLEMARPGRICFNLGAEAADVHGDSAVIPAELEVPDMIKELVPR